MHKADCESDIAIPLWVVTDIKKRFNEEAFTQASSLSVKSALLNERALLEEGVFDAKGQSLTEPLWWRRVEWKKKVWLRRYLPCPQSSSVEHLRRTGYQKLRHLLRICISSFPSSLWQWSLCGALATTFVTYLVVTLTQWVMIGQTLQ